MQKNENCGILKKIIIAHYLMPTWWVACDFSHAIASEFSDEACDCCTLLLFIRRSLHDMLKMLQGCLKSLEYVFNCFHYKIISQSKLKTITVKNHYGNFYVFLFIRFCSKSVSKI